MDKKELNKLYEAGNTLCSFCEADECEKCIVTKLIDDASAEIDEDGDGFVPEPMKKPVQIFVNAILRDGMKVEVCNFDFYVLVPEKAVITEDAAKEFLIKAARAYMLTVAGQRELDYNCGGFNWGDLANAVLPDMEYNGWQTLQDKPDNVKVSVCITVEHDEYIGCSIDEMSAEEFDVFAKNLTNAFLAKNGQFPASIELEQFCKEAVIDKKMTAANYEKKETFDMLMAEFHQQ